MEDFPTLQGPRNSTMGLEVISPSVGQGVTAIAIKSSAGCFSDDRVHPKLNIIPKESNSPFFFFFFSKIYPGYIFGMNFSKEEKLRTTSLTASLNPDQRAIFFKS